MKVIVLAISLMLGGCVTNQDVAWMTSNYYSRSDVDAINAEMACRRLARNLVEVARCEVRR